MMDRTRDSIKVRTISIAGIAAVQCEETDRAVVSDAMVFHSLAHQPASGVATSAGHPGDFLLIPEKEGFPRIKRLVVLVPAGELDEARLGIKIGKIAISGKVSILFLALAIDPELDRATKRRLNTLSWLVRDQQIPTRVQMADRSDWIQAVVEVWKEGDLVLCLDGHRNPTFIYPGKALAQALASSLKIPVYVLTGINLEPVRGQRKEWRNLVISSAAIAVIILFGFVQVLIERVSGEPFTLLLLSVSVILEILIIWKLNFLE